MRTSAFLTMLQRRLSDQNSRNFLLDEVNAAQNEILAMPEIDWMRVKGDLFLATTEDVFEYTVPYRKVSRVFERQLLDGETFGTRNQTAGYRAIRSQDVGKNRYSERDLTFDFQGSLEEGGNSTLYFPTDQNLETTTDRYRMVAYRWPAQLVSEEIPLSIPEPYTTTLLYYAVKKRVEESVFGVDLYNDQQVQKFLGALQADSANTPQQSQTETQWRW
jgi:hypothetical protein